MKKAPSKVQSNVMRAFAKKRRGYSQPAQAAPVRVLHAHAFFDPHFSFIFFCQKHAPTSPTLLNSNYHAQSHRLPYEKQRDGSPLRTWETLSTGPIASVPTLDDVYMECDIKFPRKPVRSVATPMSMAVSPKARSAGSPMAISPKLDLSFAGVVKREHKARSSSAPAMERDIPASSSGLSLPIQNRRVMQPPDKKCNYPNTLHSKVFGLHPTFGRSLELRRQWQAHVREQEGFMNSLFDGCKDFLIPGVKFRNLRQKMLLRVEKCKNEKDFLDRMSKNIRLLYSAFMALNKRGYSEVFIGDLQTNLRKIMAKVSVGLGKEYHLYDKIHENRNRFVFQFVMELREICAKLSDFLNSVTGDDSPYWKFLNDQVGEFLADVVSAFPHPIFVYICSCQKMFFSKIQKICIFCGQKHKNQQFSNSNQKMFSSNQKMFVNFQKMFFVFRAGASASLKRERSPIDAIMDLPANNKRFRK